MQARYYDPVIGRFYGIDPVDMTDVHTFNRYAYVANNPYKYIDPTGMCANDTNGNAVSGICPAFGDSKAAGIINAKLSNSNSIAGEVETKLNKAGLITFVDTTVVGSASQSATTELMFH